MTNSSGGQGPSWLRISFDQLGLLIWKNYKLQIRSWFITILEILVPALFAVILLPIRGIVSSDQYLNNTVYSPFSIDQLPDTLTPYNAAFKFRSTNEVLRSAEWRFAYTPINSNVVNTTMEAVAKNLGFNMFGFETEDLMVESLTNTNNTQFFLGGASFLNDSLDNIVYKLRYSYSPRNSGEVSTFKRDQDWKTQFLFFLFPILGPREKDKTDGGDPGYYREGFIQVQKAIDFALIQQTNPDFKNINLQLNRFPFPPYNDDKFVAIISAFLPFVLILSFVFTVILTAKAIVYEKETGIKESMKLMGMKTWIYWLSWYIKTFALLLPALIFMIVSYKIKITLKDGSQASIINQTDPYLFALFLFLFASSSITFTFLCTTFFKKANSAAAGAGTIWFFSYLPFIFISLRYEKMSFVEKILACFVNNLSMSEGMFMIGQFEGKGVGINFSNWNQGFEVGDEFNFLQILIIMFFNNFIHLLLTYYFENVIPSDYGTTKPWYFPIAWLLPEKVLNSPEILIPQNNQARVGPEIFLEDEKIYSSKNIGIQITGLRKVFKQLGVLKTAVRNLSLNIYEGQISVLLGHNGAGKSTTISMITGLTAPNSGNILIKGKDMSTETDEAKSVLGYCPQHNLLFNDMTVQEHLVFFSKLKRNYDEKEIDEMLQLINLSDKKFALSKTLSGGMKRKLSVAIAFIGGSKIVILDEPSSGMDPQARHTTWSLLQKFKKEKDCTILLTTHFMDEADFLGDRVAIMSQGELKCCGSPLFLKSKYGSGYNLVITRNRETTSDLNDDIVRSISDIVFTHVPNSKLSSNVNSEISFLLPSGESSRFPEMFNQLDKAKNNLNILNIGISITTLEEVFLKINESDPLDEIEAPLAIDNCYTNPNFKNNIEETFDHDSREKLCTDINVNCIEEDDSYGLWTGSTPGDVYAPFSIRLYLQQFEATIIKRLINSLRNKGLIISQLVIPIFILLINLLYVKYAPIKAEDSPQLFMDITQYSSNNVPYYFENLSSDNNSLGYKLMNSYGAQFKSVSNSESFNLNDNSSVNICSMDRKNINEFIGCVGTVSLLSYMDNYMVGATFTQEPDDSVSVIAHFNNQPFHTAPLTLNLMTNALLRFFSNSSSSITVINHPLPRNIKEQAEDLTTKNQTGFQVGSGLTFGFSFLIASFAIFLIKERVSDAKHLQYMSGCNSYVFWTSAFIWDVINYLIPTIAVMILLFVFQIDAYTKNWRWLMTFGLLVLYGMAHIPQMYLLSYIFKVSSTGFASLTAWNILTGQATLLPVTILTLPQLGLVDTSVVLEWLFLIIFPNFSIGQAFIDIYSNDAFGSICSELSLICPAIPNICCYNYNTTNPYRCGPNGPDDCLLWTSNFFSWKKPGLGRFFTFLPIQFMVVFVIVLIYERGYLRSLSYVIKKILSQKNNKISQGAITEEFNENLRSDVVGYGDIPKDEDVINEETRISNMQVNGFNKEIFIIDRLTKYYGSFMAVKGISFSLEKGQCFGLLGVNGAGKTSTFKMITGDEFITDGEAYLNRTSLKYNIKAFQRRLGYCPQFDPLIDQMTVLETMIMYSQLRGIRKQLIHDTCMSLIKLLDLSDHVYKMCYTLSGGNKRKLSVAIALLGSPDVILLDEPTSGMDPKTRRTLWDSINKIRNKGKSLILTTHGMDETEALCTSIGIMVNGELKCLGTLQHLKGKYGEGYTLLAKIPLVDDNQTKINEFISLILSSFTNSELKENRDGFINIQIKSNETSELANIFKLIEKSKEKYSIEYYVVTQTKLEQIFLNFASRQVDPETRIVKKGGLLKCF